MDLTLYIHSEFMAVLEYIARILSNKLNKFRNVDEALAHSLSHSLTQDVLYLFISAKWTMK